MIEGIDAARLFADCAYDTNEIVEAAQVAGMEVVIPPKKNRKKSREYKKHLCEFQHWVENAFLHLKRWRSKATQ